MRPTSRAFVLAVGVVVIGLGAASCNVRAYLAQAELFEDLRPGLVDDCCTCLALRGSGADTATCAEAVLINGVVTIPAGSSCGVDAACPGTKQCVDGVCFGGGDRGFELNDLVDDAEVPCLCQGDRETCIAALTNDGDIVVPGACIDQLDREAPCESACGGVLSFDPIQPPG